MKWKPRKWNENFIESECGKYRIAKYSTQAGDVYALWAVGKVPALHYGALDECRRIAEEADEP